jgi:hypothetical protein
MSLVGVCLLVFMNQWLHALPVTPYMDDMDVDKVEQSMNEIDPYWFYSHKNVPSQWEFPIPAASPKNVVQKKQPSLYYPSPPNEDALFKPNRKILALDLDETLIHSENASVS